MDKGFYLAFIFGIFFANWLIIPLMDKDRSFTDGFFIGSIAAVFLGVIFLASSCFL